MRILIVCNHYAVSSGRYMTDAFLRAGHEARHIGPEKGRAIWGLELPPEYAWTPDSGVRPDWADWIVVMDSDPAILEIAGSWQHDRIAVYGVDNHVRSYRQPHFMHYFLAHHAGPIQPVAQSDETWLPCGYDPTLHTPSPIPYTERQYDVCLIGVMYPQRWQLVKELRAAGVKVLAGCGLVYEAYVRAYHNSRISLCLSANGDAAQRVFETAALGNVVMSDACQDYKRLKPEGFWLFDPRDAVKDVQTILRSPAHAQEQIAVSSAWVKPHTWDTRAVEIAAWMEAEHAKALP